MEGTQQDPMIQKTYNQLNQRFEQADFINANNKVHWYPRHFDDLNKSNILFYYHLIHLNQK